MPRNSFQDIVPPDRRSIRNVPLKDIRPRAVERPAPRTEPVVEQDGDMVIVRKKVERRPEPSEAIREWEHAQEEVSKKKPRSRRRGSSAKRVFAGIVTLVIVAAVLLSTVFHGAAMAVTVKTADVTVANDFTAKKEAATGLAFLPVIIKDTAGQTVKANGEKQVSTRASGTIVIYNNYSSASQRLIKNTRFETPEGLVYRISDSVTVPGKSGSKPGSIEAVVMADEPGDKYNVGLKDLTIPGFKGDPRYQGFYARSKTPFAGGFVGTQKVVADADRAKAKQANEAALTTSLLEKAKAAMAPGAVFYDNAYVISFKDLPDESADSGSALIKEEGTISAAVFEPHAFGQAIAAATGKNDGSATIIQEPADLVFTPKSGFDPSSDSISFSLKGPATLEWTYDELALKTALKGQSRAAVSTILSNYPMIEKADISIRPFWRRSFPTSLSSIDITKTP
ncbi:MAG TPA: hypothetical protein VIR98_01160 [Candidatus Paceibacterota bacterium]|jgi:hypothetical protein